MRKLRTHCKYGHEFTEANTYRRPDRPNERTCVTCKRENWRWSRRPEASKERQRAARRLRDKLRPKRSAEELFAIRSLRATEMWNRKGRKSEREKKLRQALTQRRYRESHPEYRKKNIDNYKLSRSSSFLCSERYRRASAFQYSTRSTNRDLRSSNALCERLSNFS
jgi:hypothetical protein